MSNWPEKLQPSDKRLSRVDWNIAVDRIRDVSNIHWSNSTMRRVGGSVTVTPAPRRHELPRKEIWDARISGWDSAHKFFYGFLTAWPGGPDVDTAEIEIQVETVPNKGADLLFCIPMHGVPDRKGVEGRTGNSHSVTVRHVLEEDPLSWVNSFERWVAVQNYEDTCASQPVPDPTQPRIPPPVVGDPGTGIDPGGIVSVPPPPAPATGPDGDDFDELITENTGWRPCCA